ncbi:uncharacterized protein TRIADDRAFT_23924 [Trichoplax adhaerens]|uniref:Geranylgeranyl transferase type-1 subunit beta n=1 Tax=Trichoplax adhaerens TaxID=10228 RepID=B3RW24_TRIAD|nr:hypothetical protein TRIADDRAFT_23924 [Trichoplax adhaerens]EDV25595.1 hypothetical protein TRIADDRAFT_23924 [Trichoplax adhaerens]|eukprot:XP_002111628.1 hypothetical protein TRIADDRAFT_23924 [Trichoplax adhaerens]
MDRLEENPNAFLRSKHINYFKRTLNVLPPECEKLDPTRLSLVFFALSGLDVLNAIDTISQSLKEDIIEWIYSLQVSPNSKGSNLLQCGFRGSTDIHMEDNMPFYNGHIAMTYVALNCLLILGDDLSRVNKDGIASGLKALQLDNGCFAATLNGSEDDMRFIYCACCVSYMINDWRGVNKDKAVGYILSSITYDGGISQGPELESHAGSTFCAVASLQLMDCLDTYLADKKKEMLKRWLVNRQINGFQGRPNKLQDTCYSFWVGAALKILDAYDYIDFECQRQYLLSTQSQYTGGFSKWIDTLPDPLHSYFGICGLSLARNFDLLEIHPALNITIRAYQHLRMILDSS